MLEIVSIQPAMLPVYITPLCKHTKRHLQSQMQFIYTGLMPPACSWYSERCQGNVWLNFAAHEGTSEQRPTLSFPKPSHPKVGMTHLLFKCISFLFTSSPCIRLHFDCCTLKKVFKTLRNWGQWAAEAPSLQLFCVWAAFSKVTLPSFAPHPPLLICHQNAVICIDSWERHPCGWRTQPLTPAAKDLSSYSTGKWISASANITLRGNITVMGYLKAEDITFKQMCFFRGTYTHTYFLRKHEIQQHIYMKRQ